MRARWNSPKWSAQNVIQNCLVTVVRWHDTSIKSHIKEQEMQFEIDNNKNISVGELDSRQLYI